MAQTLCVSRARGVAVVLVPGRLLHSQLDGGAIPALTRPTEYVQE
jgi:hypothetical protein